jgi:tungstate transport system substrate-binding protein|tara:strand:+ start:211 stop:1059 length:849 start_codon:yes stop_codon:yes gene_type:complete
MRIQLKIFLFLLLISTGCLSQNDEKTLNKISEPKEITISTTTSIDDSGLLKILNQPFEEKYKIRIKVIAEGTGKALKTAELGGSDVVIVHSREKEIVFIKEGFGVNKRDLMHNNFIIVGPESDPAGISDMKSGSDAFNKIANSKSRFFSRGDESGTHVKEKLIWKKIGILNTGTWYKSIGKGMGDTLIAANAQNGYTLSDQSTYLKIKERINLVILVEGDPIFYNPYSVIAVNPARYPDKNEKYQMVMLYIGYLTSPEGQRIISEYGQDEFGHALFYPDAIL